MATKFGVSDFSHYRDRTYPRNCLARLESERSPYYLAMRDFEVIEAIDNDVVRKLRARNSSLSKISFSDIINTVPACDPGIARRLCMEFVK